MQLKELTKKTLNMDILYIEDDENLRVQNQELFKSLFNKVDIADNGVDAMELYKKQNYDLVIADINIPLLNGINTMKKMKELNNSQLFLVTSVFQPSEWEKDLEYLGIKHYLKKPLQTKELIDSLRALSQDLEFSS